MQRRSEPLVSVCRVERGLYAIRYVEAPGSPPPVAHIAVLSGDVSMIPAPGRAEVTLDAPGQALVILAQTAGEFEIRVTAAGGDGADAKFSVDLLDPGEQRRRETSNVVHRRTFDDRRSVDQGFGRPDGGAGMGLSVLAHVSRRGDVRVGTGEWVAGPDEILPIEGMSISVGRPDLGVRIRVQSTESRQRWSPWHDPEEFAGSRQQADALTAIALALTGDAADQYEIVADVMALGMPSVSKRGNFVEFFGVDPIVGFRFALQDATAGASERVPPLVAPLRVFRAKR